MNIMILGPQGSGKGTQAKLLIEKFNFFYFESGAYLRKMAEKYPSIKKIMDEGKLVPDEEFTSYLTAYLDQENLYDNVIFDGFPRTLVQYRFLQNWLTQKNVKIDLVLVLDISDDEAVRRLSARRTDPETGTIYNLVTAPPPASVDVSKLIQRSDDQPDAIRERLKIYRTNTQELVNALKKETEVIEMNAERPVDVIQSDIVKIVEERQNK